MHTSSTIKIFLAILFSSLSLTLRGASSTPDFAFPKKVSQDAEATLAEALKRGDEVEITKSLIEIYIAGTLVDQSDTQQTIERIEEVASTNDLPTLKAVLSVLEAEIYYAFYDNRRYIFDRRELPLTPLPAKIDEWSGAQFKIKIASLLERALQQEAVLKATPISAYSSVIEFGDGSDKSSNRLSAVYYPTLFDFVAYRSIKILSDFSTNDLVLSFGVLTPYNIYIDYPFNASDPYVKRILELYASLLKFHIDDTPALLHADLERIDFIYDDIMHFSGSDARKETIKLLTELYENNKDSQYSGDVLIAFSNLSLLNPYMPFLYEEEDLEDDEEDDSDGNTFDESSLYNALKTNIDCFPDYPRVNTLKNIMSRLAKPSMSVSTPVVAGPGQKLTLAVNMKNVEKGKIIIYDVSDSPIDSDTYEYTGQPKAPKIAELEVAVSGVTIPFAKVSNVSFAFPKVGQYIAVPVIDGMNSKGREEYRKIRVTDFTLGISHFGDTRKAFAINAMSGAPVEGASISLYQPKTKLFDTLGSTDAMGALSLAPKTVGRISVSKGNDKFALAAYCSPSYNNAEQYWVKRAHGFTSLPLYRPGDRMEWSAVCYEFKNKSHRPDADKRVTVTLRDVSNRAIDTLTVTTDSFGRINGTFDIPSDALTGTFNIFVEDYYAYIPFEVSDYKLPGFKVVLNKVETTAGTSGEAVLRGQLITYSGFPVEGADVKIRLSAFKAFPWWQRGNPIQFRAFETTSDSDGNFELVIPAEILRQSPIPNPVYRLSVDATSPNGETQSASTIFSDSKQYAIFLSAPENIDISAPVSDIKIKVEDYQGNVVDLPLEYTLTASDGVEAAKGKIEDIKKPFDFSRLKSGEYELKIAAEANSLAQAVSCEFVLYRPKDKTTPMPDNILWYPENKIKISDNRDKASWLYAVNRPSYLLVSLHTDTTLISQDWVKVDAGMHRLPVSLPKNIDNARLEISVTGNYQNATARIYLEREITEPSIKFITETFRDRIMPGSDETWTFRIMDQSGKGVKSAVILDMYNTALDALVKQNFTFTPQSSSYAYAFSWNQPFLNYSVTSNAYTPALKPLWETPIYLPQFNTYGYPFVNREIVMYELSSMKKSRAMADTGVVREYKNEVIVEESADMELSDGFTAAYGIEVKGYGKTSDDRKEPEFQYRDREVPLAFFRPMLTTDEEGRLSFSFSVPNANTTWGFRAVAYTDSLLSTSFAKDVIANKPVMVQPNLPRFLRAGDKAIVQALVMNNSDDEQKVSTHIEIFNASDGKTIKSFEQSDVITAGGSTKVSIEIDAPTDAPFIGYRIKSSTDAFADGEQTLLPVLEASSPLYETYPFYIAPDEQEFSLSIPPVKADALTTLQYCDNPIWYVITALPGILDREASTANEAAASIFSAALASGLVRDNPEIAEAFAQWEKSGRDAQMLTSMLEQNAELKQLLLSSTPWMNNAKNDNERMARLSLLFDDKFVRGIIDANISTLEKLLCDDGGWSWFSSYKEPSMWATENVLMLFGDLLRLGYLPDSPKLNKMIASSFKWFDKKTEERYRKYQSGDFSIFVLLHERFSGFKGVNAPSTAIVKSTVNNILSSWRKASVVIKAIDAQILAAHSYKTEAKKIIESLRQFSTYTPQKGMWWPTLDDMTLWSMGKVGATSIILDAFSAIEPGCEDIDRIRQWLILRKETMDWGTSVSASQIIASILSSSKKWLAKAGDTKIMIGKEELKPSDVDLYTGYFKMPVSLAKDVDNKLTIEREAQTPAWGAVYVLSTEAMADVRSKACDELSIEKSEILKTATADGIPSAQFAESLKVGDIVSVTLTIHVNRDMDYVTIVDERPACFEPKEQLPVPIVSEGIYFYRENRDAESRFFINYLPKGTYILTYDVTVNNAGDYASGIATIQSQYAPRFAAHSAGTVLKVNERD